VDGGSFPNGPPPAFKKARADPSLEWRDKDGLFYYAAIDLPGNLNMWRSADDCETFSFYSTITGTTPGDREMMVIDNNPSSDYYGRFYVAWYNTFDVGVIYSDDGIDWATPTFFPSPDEKTQAPWPAVDPISGTVYVAWTVWNPPDYSGLMRIRVARSTDGGAEWNMVTDPRPSVVVPRDLDATDDCWTPALHGHVKHYAVPQIVVDNFRNLHVVYSYDPDGFNIGDVSNVYYRRSTDQGANWETEVRLNDDDTDTDQWFPTVSVGPSGTVVATWYDRRNDPDNNRLYDYYMAVSLDNGVTWGPNIRVSDVSSDLPTLYPNFDPTKNWDCYHGDYDQQVQVGAFAYITWSDDRNIQYGHPDPDVWFERVLVTPDLYNPVYLPLIIKVPPSL
jgi:hypothetical protein